MKKRISVRAIAGAPMGQINTALSKSVRRALGDNIKWNDVKKREVIWGNHNKLWVIKTPMWLVRNHVYKI